MIRQLNQIVELNAMLLHQHIVDETLHLHFNQFVFSSVQWTRQTQVFQRHNSYTSVTAELVPHLEVTRLWLFQRTWYTA